MSFQQIVIEGRLGRDVETRYTGDGDPVASFSVAVSEKRKGEEQTEWFSCVAFKKTAEVASEYLSKGSHVLIVGKLKTDSWEKDGEKKYRTQVMVNQLVLLGSKQAEKPAEQPAPKPAKKEGGGMFDDIEDDIPFSRVDA